MYKLIENYLYEVQNILKPRVQSYNVEGQSVIFVFRHEYSNEDSKDKLSIWDLMIYLNDFQI